MFASGGRSMSMLAVGVAMTGYGAYVGGSRRSYWVSSVTYVMPIVAIAWVAGAR